MTNYPRKQQNLCPSKICTYTVSVTREMVKEFKERLKEINARPIKKITETKARKK